MGSELIETNKIPVIDLSNEDLKQGTNTWIKTCKAIREALEEYGCFEAIYNKVTVDLDNKTFETGSELFDLPIETKRKNTSDKPYFEYYGQYSTIPLYESVAIADPASLQSTKSFTELMWPLGNDLFCESAYSMSKIMVELDHLVMRMLFESYGIESSYNSYYSESVEYMLRYLKYRERVDEKETTMGITPHTDKTFMSIIKQHYVKGLQIRTRDGVWIDVQPSNHSSFVVMAGDVLMAWSNDRIFPCCHQVIIDHYCERYSLGLFSFMNGPLHVPQELVDDTNCPLKYKPFQHFDFLRFFRTESPDKRFSSSIKTYCGINS